MDPNEHGDIGPAADSRRRPRPILIQAIFSSLRTVVPKQDREWENSTKIFLVEGRARSVDSFIAVFVELSQMRDKLKLIFL